MKMTRTFGAVPLMLLAALVLAPAAAATAPGHSGRIVYSSIRTGSYQLATIGPSGGDLRQLTHVDGDAINPDWSPNGRWIAFELDTADDARIVWLRATGERWKAICWKVGLARTAANQRWLYGLCVIAWKLSGREPPRRRSRQHVIEQVRAEKA